jgi:branched-chain amino acid transport system permease protein
VVLGLIQSFSVLIISSQWQTLVRYAFLFVTIIFFPLGFRLPLWLRRAFKPAA